MKDCVPSRRSLVLAVALAGGLLANAVASAADAIVDSGAWVMSGGNRAIYWLDEHRVLFIGHEGIKAPSEGATKPSLLQWQVGKAVTVVRSNVWSLCVRSGGRVEYSVREADGTRSLYQGSFGKESKVERRGVDVANCDSTRVRNDRKEDRVIRPLLREHGYLLLGPALGPASMENSPVRFIREGQAAPISLPFGRRELGQVDYYEFKQAYFVKLDYFDANKKVAYARWPAGTNPKAFWLTPEGATERIELPNDVQFPRPTAAGFAYLIFGTRSDKDGLYLYRADQRALVMRGYVTEFVTSPDGCELAFAHAPDDKSNRTGPQSKRTLKVADVCKGRAGK